MLRGLVLLVVVVAALIAAFYLIIAILMIVKQDRWIYQPRRVRIDAQTPCHASMPYKPVALRTPDGVSIHGWFVNGPHPDCPVILFCHGNAGNIGNRITAVSQFVSIGFHCFIFDYRGFGNSSGKPSEDGLVLDARTAWHFLVETAGYHPQRLLLLVGLWVVGWQRHLPISWK